MNTGVLYSFYLFFELALQGNAISILSLARLVPLCEVLITMSKQRVVVQSSYQVRSCTQSPTDGYILR